MAWVGEQIQAGYPPLGTWAFLDKAWVVRAEGSPGNQEQGEVYEAGDYGSFSCACNPD